MCPTLGTLSPVHEVPSKVDFLENCESWADRSRLYDIVRPLIHSSVWAARERNFSRLRTSGALQLVPDDKALESLSFDYARMVEDGLLFDEAEPFVNVPIDPQPVRLRLTRRSRNAGASASRPKDLGVQVVARHNVVNRPDRVPLARY